MKKSPRTRSRGSFLVLAALLMLAVWLWPKGADRLQREQYPKEYSEYVEYYAGKYSLDPLLVYAFIRTESGFDPKARSNVDARGLMQLTEQTFSWIQSKIAPDEGHGFDEIYDPELNIRFGTYYLCACLNRYEGDISTAAAAYHSGWGTVDGLLTQKKYSADGRTLSVFPYTQMNQYVKKINTGYQVYQKLYSEEEA